MPLRPGRAAADAAREALNNAASTRVVISDSDDDDDGEEESDDEASSSVEEEEHTKELSAYELQREENIARNKEVLRQLGLAGPTPPAKKTNGNAPSSSGSRKDRGATSRADSSAASRKRQRDETGKERQCTANPSEPNGHESPRPLDLEEEDADAYYRLLLGNQPPSSMLGPELIQRAASDLGLDIENKFNANAIRLMIDVFDTQGAGRISRSDFKLLLRQVKRSKH